MKNIDNLLKKFKEVHKNKYFYDKMVYIKTSIKIIITCPIHGDFECTPNNHRQGSGCPKCGILKMKKSKLKTTEQIIKEFIEVHGDTYSYDKVDYDGGKVIITCPIHGDFKQGQFQHIKGQGCPKCPNGKGIKTTELIIKEFIEVHGDTYSYDKVDYDGINKPVIIICKKHGEFKQKPVYHKHGKSGCPKCANEKTSYEKYKDRPTILYYVKVNNLWKIGICLLDKRFKTIKSNILKKRFITDIKNDVKIEILKTKVYEDGWNAYLKEQSFLEKFDKDRYMYKSADMNWFTGYTELFKRDIRN